MGTYTGRYQTHYTAVHREAEGPDGRMQVVSMDAIQVVDTENDGAVMAEWSVPTWDYEGREADRLLEKAGDYADELNRG